MGERYWQFRSYYADLELKEVPPPSLNDVKKAYRRLAMQWHPDKNPGDVAEATEKFKILAEAFEVLSNPGLRARYDSQRGMPSSSASSSHNSSGSQAASQDLFHDSFHAEMQKRHANFTFDQADRIFREFFGGEAPFAKSHSSVTSQGVTAASALSPIVSTSSSESMSTDSQGRCIRTKVTKIIRGDGSIEEKRELSFDESGRGSASGSLDHHAIHAAALLQAQQHHIQAQQHHIQAQQHHRAIAAAHAQALGGPQGGSQTRRITKG